MNEILNLLVRHGIAVLFAVEFIEQVGIPLPAAPWLLAAGALIGAGKMNWWMALSTAALGSLLGDLIWFFLGRYYGNRVLGLLSASHWNRIPALAAPRIYSRDTACPV